jgi:phosphoglycerol transferase MdoB-like AlkP superfamily enzyme
MKRRVEYLAAYFLYWVVFAVFFKIIFLLYHASQSVALEAKTIAGIFLYGLRLDLAFAAYAALIPFLLVVLSGLFNSNKWVRVSLKAYTTLMLIFFTILCTSDLELFRIWGFRLDASPLLYLNTPEEMFVSLGSSPLWLLILLNLIINISFNYAYKKLIHPLTSCFGRERLLLLPVFSLAGILLIIPMRGGLQQAPVTLASAYFSETIFANQAAINIPWNFFYSLRKQNTETENPYIYLSSEKAGSLLNKLYKLPRKSERRQILHTAKPNIVLIIWESFTTKAVEPLGGLAGVTPSFNTLSNEGTLFTNMYASGDRSDKGIVSLLSGWPAQPGASLLKNPEKTLQIPHLSKSFTKAGYRTSFYYGGTLDFANLGTYVKNGNFQNIISKEQFLKKERNAKWGVHDHVMLNRIYSDIESEPLKQPFFKVLFTLSSHEPFDFPGAPHFNGKGASDMFLSALHYTDAAIGNFIASAREQDWYKNTLFIIVADHGHTYPGGSAVYEREKFHIPMLWLGGALAAPPTEINSTLSQTDLAASLLGQLSLPADEFRWSRDVFLRNSASFAPYFFKDGVGFVTDSSYLSFDNTGKQLIETEGTTGKEELPFAKAYLQQSYGDYLNK